MHVFGKCVHKNKSYRQIKKYTFETKQRILCSIHVFAVGEKFSN